MPEVVWNCSGQSERVRILRMNPLDSEVYPRGVWVDEPSRKEWGLSVDSLSQKSVYSNRFSSLPTIAKTCSAQSLY